MRFTLLLLLGLMSWTACTPGTSAPDTNQAAERYVPPSIQPAAAPAATTPPAEAHQALQATSAGVTPSRRTFNIFGYHAWWMKDAWRDYDFDMLDKVFYFELRVAADGSFEDTYGYPYDWSALRQKARGTRTPYVPTLVMIEAPEKFEQLFGNEAAVARLIENTMAMVRASDADGLHLDFELFGPVNPLVRDRYTAFVQRLRAELNAYRAGSQLSMFFPAFEHTNAFNEPILAQMMDHVVVQGYDMHWLTAPTAGPISPLTGWNGANWRNIVDRFVAMGVPRSKILMTVAYYGYEWPTETGEVGSATRGQGKAITYAPISAERLPNIQTNALDQSARHGLRRDPTSDTPYYAYQGEDGWYQGWFEDEQSLTTKYDFIEQEQLGGIAIFPLGYDRGQLANALQKPY
ncbi:MAG: glycosyl hydrolase family 18 protein [Bacteroidota bacterium]